MKLEVSDSHSNHSDFSCDSQSSQGSSTNDFSSSVPTSRSLLTVSDFLIFKLVNCIYLNSKCFELVACLHVNDQFYLFFLIKQ